MSAAPVLSSQPPSRELAVPLPAALIVGGRYLSVRKIVVFAADLLWFLVSSIAITLLNGSGAEDITRRFALALLLVGVYVSSFYLMDIYEQEPITEPKEFALNLLLALGLVSVATAVAQK